MSLRNGRLASRKALKQGHDGAGFAFHKKASAAAAEIREKEAGNHLSSGLRGAGE